MDNLPGTGMLVDEYDQYSQQDNNVVDISPDDASEEQTEAPTRADEFESMKSLVLPDPQDLETEAEAYYTWDIKDWRQLPKKEHSGVFECGGSRWRILFFPFGNGVDCASFYLEHGYGDDAPKDWYACVQFALVLWNPNDPTLYRTQSAQHRFNAKEADWGFTRFVELRKAFHQTWEGSDRRLVEDDAARMTAYVRVVKDPTGVLWHNFEGYDSKQMTGMVGLKNQGATCYLNSLLQSLYFTNAFRKAVYQIPTAEDATKGNNAWTLQRLFYRLQKNKLAVSTNELTGSFGWDSRQIFEQQDVQELLRILMEKLEERMKGSAEEKTLHGLFAGKSKTYVSCINVDYESSLTEEFWDIQLSIKGHRTLHESFMNLIQVETLEGDNKYDAGEAYGKQDARKGVIFESFPPILHLHLIRVEYDINRDAMMKINDRLEFPEELDVSPYLSKDADRSESWMYQLHGVLVHSGDFNAGHYYAFLKPTKDGSFYKFDDDRVTKTLMKEVLEENYGGENPAALNGTAPRQQYLRGYATKRSNNAYMLVYIRKSKLDEVLPEVVESDIPRHIEARITEEQAELAKIRKDREEEHLYLSIGVITEKTFRNHHGFDLTKSELPAKDPAAAQYHRIRRTTKIKDFAATIAVDLDVGADQVRFWSMVGRQNKTIRPDQPLRDAEMTVEEAATRYSTKGKYFNLWAETAPRQNGIVKFEDPNQISSGNVPILVFLKYFDVEQQTLSGVGHVYVQKLDKVAEIAPKINEIMQWDTSTQILLFEEIKSNMIDPMKPKQTFGQSEIQDGDIICFQKSLSDLDAATTTYTDARQYYEYLLNRISVTFYPRTGDGGEEFQLSLSKKMTYDQFSAKVGEHLGVDPTHIRFATINAANGRLKTWVKRNLNHSLSQTLQSQFSYSGNYSPHRNDSLYYEILETSLADYETKKIIRVIWLSEGITKDETLEILVPRNGIVDDLLAGIVRKLKLDEASAKHLRIYEAQNGKISRELLGDLNVSTISEYNTLYAEKIPDEEISAAGDDKDVYAFHFDKEPSKPHGTPFKFIVKPGEPFKDTRERISKRTGIKGKPLQNIKFAVVPRGTYAKPRYIEDDEILHDTLGDEDKLGLDHVNKAKNFWNRAEGMFIK